MNNEDFQPGVMLVFGNKVCDDVYCLITRRMTANEVMKEFPDDGNFGGDCFRGLWSDGDKQTYEIDNLKRACSIFNKR